MSYSTKGIHEVADGINERTHTKLPLGWVILTVGLVAFAVYYIFANMPQWGGWRWSSSPCSELSLFVFLVNK